MGKNRSRTAGKCSKKLMLAWTGKFPVLESTAHEKGSMLITIFAFRFGGGIWLDWEHTCDENELEAVADSARAKAADHDRPGSLLYLDYLEGAKYIFNTAFGTAENPREGDTNVYAVVVDQMVIGRYEELKRHFALKLSA